MASKAKTSVKPDYQPDAQYRVRLLRTVKLVGGQMLRPSDDDVVVKGKVAAKIDDAIESAELV